MTDRSSGPTASSIEETIARVRGCTQVLAVERVALDQACGRVLRESVAAREDQPPFDRSSMDGFAVRLDDASTRFRIVDRIRAGDWKPRGLSIGEAVQIATGGALPCPELQVVIREATEVEGEWLTVRERGPERCIRFRGEDARAGETLLEPGVRLSPGALGLLASLGHADPLVTRQPRVLHVATGNELVSPDLVPADGQIRDSNSTLVRTFLGQWGVTLRQLRVAEAEAVAHRAIEEAASGLGTLDLLLISGGASVGPHDFTADLLVRLGFVLHIRRTATRPGRPLLFGTRGATLAFGLPGNPLAHFVCLNLYVRQAIEGMSGVAQGGAFRSGRLTARFNDTPNARETLWPARLEITGEGVGLRPLSWRSSGDLTPLATANALVRIPPGTDLLPVGSPVRFMPTSLQP
ncbi:MAG: molybdopterin molybdotransferase MoeA [Verrucomicrobiales bacterium]|nr:molybdopterin molybdotransferase MoeA [Verrucomicrobiales bacterium]